jgi:hypothetical protein
MKPFNPGSLIVVIILSLLISCGKDHDDNPYYIEAEMNGVKWRGNVTDRINGAFVASGNNGSKMLLWVSYPPTGDPFQPYSFHNTASLKFPQFYFKDTVQLYFSIGAYDSKYKVKLKTIFENDIDRFYVEQAAYPDTESKGYKLVASIPATGTSTSTQEYSYTLNDLNIKDLGKLIHRIKVVTKSGISKYSNQTIFNVHPVNGQVAYCGSNGNLRFALDNDQNQMTITNVGPGLYEKSGTFSYRFVNEAGDTVRVTNGKFHVNE